LEKRQTEPVTDKPPKLSSQYLLAAVLIIAILISSISIGIFLEKLPSGYEKPIMSQSSGGKARDVDTQQIREMIQSGRLSQREADFYKKLNTDKHQGHQ
jgi:hypothetical protein